MPKNKKFLKTFKLLFFFLFESKWRQRKGKIIKPNGKKKYGGNKSDVRTPKIKKIKILNYFYLLLLFQFFYYLI